MKKILFLLTILILTLASCSKSSELSNSIPADSFYVLRVDAKSLIKKSDYDIFQNSAIQRLLSFGRIVLKDDQIKLLNQFLENPNSLGLDLKDQYYMYIKENEVGLVLKVLDAKKMNDNLKIIASGEQATFKDGVYSLKSYNAVIVWNDDRLIILNRDLNPSKYIGDESDTKVDNQDATLEYAKGLLTQSSDKSINSLEVYKKYIKDRDQQDISIFYSLDKITNYTMSQFKGTDKEKAVLKAFLKEFDGLYYGGQLNFEIGNIASLSEFLYDSPEATKRLKDFVARFSSPITGTHFKYIPKNPMLITSFNLKGDEINKYLNEIGVYDLLAEKQDTVPIDLQTILKNIEGEATFFVSDFSITKENTSTIKEAPLLSDDSLDFDEIEDFDPDIDDAKLKLDAGLLATVANPDSIYAIVQRAVKKDSTSNRVEEVSPRVFKAVVDQDNTVYFGVNENLFFVTSSEEVYQAVAKGKSISQPYAANFGNALNFVEVDVTKINSAIIQYILPANTKSDMYGSEYQTMISMYSQIFGIFESYEYLIDSFTLYGKGNITLTNKKDNSLKTICLTIDKALSESVSSLMSQFN